MRRKLWPGCLIPLLVLALAFCVDLRPRPSSETATVTTWSHGGSGSWEAGFASATLNPPPELPLGGYAARRRASFEGVRDSVSVRAFTLGNAGAQVSVVAVDVVLIPESLRSRVQEQLGPDGPDGLWLVATHTHSGPGGHWDHPVAEWGGLGDFDAAWFEVLAQTIAGVVRTSAAELYPANLRWGHAEVADLAIPRSNGMEAPPEMRLLAVDGITDLGSSLGGVLMHPAHATVLREGNRLLSSDWPGAAARGLEDSLGGTWLVVSGPCGDLKPALELRDPDVYGARVVDRALAVRETATEVDPGHLAGATWVGPAPPGDATGLVPSLFAPIVSNALGWLIREPVRIEVLELGEIRWIGLGAEPVRAVARRLEEAHAGETVVVPLVNGYLGYVELPERVRNRAGEGMRTYFGPPFFGFLEEATGDAVKGVGGQGRLQPQ